MEAESNVTYITFDGHVEVHRYELLYFLIMLTMYILILCSNSVIVCVIWIHKNLHEPMYIFIAALLINSVLFSTSVYPKLLIDFLSAKQVISHSMCHLQYFLVYALGGSEFLLLTIMAFDRYVSICKPLQYPTIMSNRSVRVLLVLAWSLPSCQVGVAVILDAQRKLCKFSLKGVFCNNTVVQLYCVDSSAMIVHGFIVLFNVTVFPVLFILFTYTRILIISYHSRDVRTKAAQTCIPHLIILINYSGVCVYDLTIMGLDTEVPKTVHLIMTLQLFLCHPLINPVIYGLKMREISKHLRRLLKS